MRLYTVYLLLQVALHVSGSVSTHHQERVQLHLQPLVLDMNLCSYLPPTGGGCTSSCPIPEAVDTVIRAPDGG
jgi:hypothetical protein